LLPRGINPPAPFVLVALWHYGGAMQRVDSTKTAFMGREKPFLFSVDAVWDDPKQNDEVLAYSRAYLAEMEPYSPGGLYVNFSGFGEEGQELVRSIYGANYTRLAQLKQKYDPNNLFRMNQNIVPASTESQAATPEIAGVPA